MTIRSRFDSNCTSLPYSVSWNLESGFSVNENLLQVNMKESSIVSQRFAYEGIRRGGGVVEVKVTPELQKRVKSSYRTYKAAREEAT